MMPQCLNQETRRELWDKVAEELRLKDRALGLIV